MNDFGIKNREFKGKSLLEFPSDYCLIKVETTGLDVNHDFIIEIAALKIRSNLIVDEYSTLVKTGAYINNFIESFTGITNDMVSFEGKPEHIAIRDLKDFVGDDLLVGYGINFHLNFLYDCSILHLDEPIKNNFVDVNRIARRVLTSIDGHGFRKVSKYLHLNVPIHRSLHDCNLIYNIYNELLTIILEKFETTDFFLKEVEKITCEANAKNVTTINTVFNSDNPLYLKNCVFTGALSKLTRKEAMQELKDIGGIPQNGINSDTNFLVVGDLSYIPSVKDGKSTKQKLTEKKQLDGQDIQVISESTFYSMLKDI